MNIIPWLVILVLVLLNALYVAAEFAAVGVRRGQVRQAAREGNRAARGLLPILEDHHALDRYIAACQIGITLSSLIVGAFGQATIAVDLAGMLVSNMGMEMLSAVSVAALVVLIFLTILQVVFGELVPKSLALQFPTRVALLTYRPMIWSVRIYSIFISVLNGSGILLLRSLGVDQGAGHRHIHSPEEISMLLAESRDGGLLEPEEQRRLHQALQLSQRTARQLMVPRRLVEALDIEIPTDQILKSITDSPYTRLPVYNDTIDNVVGVLHTKDLAAFYAANGTAPPIAEILRPAVTVPDTATGDQLLELLRKRAGRLAIVVDEFGGLAGIVTLEDMLAELLGDVADEFKGGHAQPEILPDGRVRIPGILRLDEAESWIGRLWQDTDASTVGGHVIGTMGMIPAGGEKVIVDGLEVEIERMDGNAVASVIVTPAPPETTEEE